MRKARRGELVNFTGIDSEYEAPELPEILLNTTIFSPEECVDQILSSIENGVPVQSSNGSRVVR